MGPSMNPKLDCVWLNGDGSWISVWKYKNPHGATTIPVGTDNRFTGSPAVAEDQGQFTSFLAFQTPESAEFFTVTMPSTQTSITWHLDGKSKTASKPTSSTCPTEPVPLIAGVPDWVTLVALPILIVGAALVLDRRRSSAANRGA